MSMDLAGVEDMVDLPMVDPPMLDRVMRML